MKVLVSVLISKEIDLDASEDCSKFDLLEKVEALDIYPSECYNYLTDEPNSWVIDNVEVLRLTN